MTPVDPLVVAVLVVLAALVGIVAGFIGARVQDRFRLTKSQTDAKDIVARAEKEANNLRKEAELKTKDEFFKKREEFNREIEKDRQEVREQERRLEKREDTLDQKHQVLLKKERSLEHTQRKLHERRELVEKRGQELEALLLTQTQRLHEITGLNREIFEVTVLSVGAGQDEASEFLRLHADHYVELPSNLSAARQLVEPALPDPIPSSICVTLEKLLAAAPSAVKTVPPKYSG